MPEAAIRALVRPEAALKRLERFTKEFNATLELPQGASPRARLNHAEGVLSRLFPNLPAVLPLAGLGFAMLGLAGRLLGAGRLFGAREGGAGQDGAAGSGNTDLQPVLRGLPNNVTTEMDLELWRVATAIKSDAESLAVLTGIPPRCWRSASPKADCRPRPRPAWQGSWRGTGIGPSPRSTSACPLAGRPHPYSWCPCQLPPAGGPGTGP